MKKNKKLNLYFEEQSSFRKEKNENENRNNFVISTFLIVFTVICARLIFLGFEKSDFIVSKNNDKFFYERKDIIDSQGIILAKNITVYDLVLRKSKVKNIQSILLKAKINFSDIDTENLKLENEDKSIVILKKNLSPADYNKVIALGEPALELSKREIRIYPHKNLFSHILGKVDIDNRGISGMEMYLDDKLKDKSDLNIPVQTSLDANIQFLVYEELLKAVGDCFPCFRYFSDRTLYL